MKENKFWSSDRGAGVYIVDSGFVIENCQFRGNRLGGLIISGSMPNKRNGASASNNSQYDNR